MEWKRTGLHVEESDTIPPYRVVRFRIEGKSLFRPAFKGEFLAFPVARAKGAKEICERHHAINQEARAASEKEHQAGLQESPA